MRRSALFIAAAAALITLSACAGTPAPIATVTVTPSPVATSAPPVVPTPTPTPTATPPVEPELVPNPAVGEPIPNAPAPIVEPGPANDLGEAPGARGSTTSNGDGSLSTYTVVEGDTFFDIAQRFDVPVQQFLHMNPSVPGLGEEIYLKQVINLDWTKKR